MAQNTIVIMDSLDKFLMHIVRNFPWNLFPWSAQLNLTDQRAFVLEILEAVHRRDDGQLATRIEDWEATADALRNSHLIDIMRKPYDPGDYMAWEQIRGEFDLSGNPEERSI
jgi:hypothetical protein